VDEGKPSVLHTQAAEVRATHVVLATHLPILDRGLFFAKAHPKRSYVVGGPIPGSADPGGMYLEVGESTHSVRTAHNGDQLMLLVGGEGHKAGQEPDTLARYRALEVYARERFGLEEITHRWSTQDHYSVDGIPYIGQLAPWSDRTWVATGFKAWGMTGGTVAGMLLRELIQGRPSEWADLYDSTRLSLKAGARELLAENMDSGARWAKDRMASAQGSVDALAPGEGGVVSQDGHKIAAYRDDAGQVHSFSATCTHLGCLVGWNSAEKTWDCPCHGSRFSYHGEPFEGPAVKPLEPA
jgi:nitrite reductase/ring-hydroxylating ferredoxin subunit